MTLFEDGCALADKAACRLLAEKKAMHLPVMRMQPLAEFLQKAAAQRLTAGDREVICDQAILLVEQFYAHLPFKRARYAIDPVQRLRLLRARLGQIEADLSFHSELLDAFAELRDCHTTYHLPPPFAGAIAFLPFFLQSYFDKHGERHFLVTDLMAGFQHPFFGPGAEILQWNGMPVARAVELLAQHIPGGNPAAKFMRGMMRMTVRSLGSTLPPDEEVVFIRYQPLKKSEPARIMQLPWFVGTGMGTGLFQVSGMSVCEPLKDLSIICKVLWRRDEWKEQQSCGPGQNRPNKALSLTSKLPNIFQFQHSDALPDAAPGAIDPALLASGGKRFGYIRIKTFEGDDDEIFGEFRRILELMQVSAPDGLMVDPRGNAGGSVSAAERLLQLLTPGEITPAPVQFANTPTLQDFVAKLKELSESNLKSLALQQKVEDGRPYFKEWFADNEEARVNGSLLTRGRPFTSPDSANDTGQVYYGPVVLLIDAASYSATELFAAGFQDHGIGEIIGVDANTGGGGAIRWLHNQELVGRLQGVAQSQPPLQPLPAGASMTLALQRSARVGPNAGEPIEDIGVKCTIPYKITKADLQERSRHLIAFACRVLAKKPTYLLQVIHSERIGADLHVELKSANLDCLVCLLDGQPQLTLRAAQTQTFRIPRGFGRSVAQTLCINGYTLSSHAGQRRKRLTLVAAVKLPLVRS